MNHFEIVAHRGIPTEAPENTIPSFQRAIELGADAIELDVRLTSDRMPVVYHYFYLEEATSASGAIFDFTFEQLRSVQVFCKNKPNAKTGRISSFQETLDVFGGRIGLEIEIKGPEPEAPEIIGNILIGFKNLWHTIEITSYEPSFLQAIKRICPGLTVDLLFPRSEPWMKLDVVQYEAIHYSHLAGARAVHLHPTQLSEKIVTELRRNNVEVHAWDVNDERSLEIVKDLGIPRLCTDNFEYAFAYRERLPRLKRSPNAL
jgi:glycerophosphoryl diester phosphodiesterase